MTVRTALASVLVVSLGAGASGLAEPSQVDAVTAPTKLTLMGWNIRGLGQNQTWEVARESIIAYMLDSGADIIALQEARRAVADMMADPALGSRYDFYQTASDQPILIDKSLPLTVSDDGPSGVGLCSGGTVATIQLPSEATSFRLYNSHFCFDPRNATDGSDLVRVADPGDRSQMVVAIGDLNTSPRFNPEFGAEFGLTVEPLEHSFGEVELGAAVLRKVTVTNHAPQDVDISAIRITGRGRSQFDLPARRDACSGAILAPRQSCRFRVGFEPTATGQQRAKAVIDSNDPNGSKIRVKLRGTAVTDLRAAGGVKNSSRSGRQHLGELVLVNGNILTMDRVDRVVSGVRIVDGHFVEVGDDVSVGGSDVQVIDLGGRTVTPGLIDTHIHYFRDAHVPGHLLSSIERVFTIPDLLSAVTERAVTVPAGEFITVLGRFNPSQFAENRLPTLAELDGAAPGHPVYLQTGFDGPAATNTPGKGYFEAHGVVVDSSGVFNRGQTDAPVQALFDEFANADTLRTVGEYMRFSASLGLTMVQNYSGCGGFGRLPAGTRCEENFLDLWQRRALRLRIGTSVGGTGTQTDGSGIYQVVPDTEAALQELEDLGGGDDMFDFSATGEFVVGNFGSTSAPFEDAYRQIAERGWSLRQHSISPAENEAHISAFEAVDSVVPIAEMRWAVEHVFSIGADHTRRLGRIGAGATVQNQQYLLGGSGPPYRDLLDSGIALSAGTDAAAISPMSPWISLYHMVTGRDSSGRVVNAGQQITRMEALRIYTRGGAWHTFEDEEVGSIEVGKLADLVVLSDDYLSVPDQEIRTLSSVLTLVGGATVHAAAEFVAAQPRKPKNLRAVAVAPTEVTLRWDDRSDNEDSFEIQMQPPGKSFGIAAIVGADVDDVTITDLTPATTYRFRVRALAGSEKSGFSNKLSVDGSQRKRSAPR